MDISELTVRLGEYDTSDDKEIPPHEDFAARRIIIHKNFKDDPELVHDIAVIQLDTLVSFKSHIIPVCLPESGVNFQNEEAVVSGWGYTGNSKPYRGKLRMIRVKVRSNAECATYMKTHHPIVITENHLCAGSNSSAICIGDSGGPLVVSKSGRAVLIGLVTGGFEDCEMPQRLAVCANVSTHMQWVEATIDRGCPFGGIYRFR